MLTKISLIIENLSLQMYSKKFLLDASSILAETYRIVYHINLQGCPCTKRKLFSMIVTRYTKILVWYCIIFLSNIRPVYRSHTEDISFDIFKDNCINTDAVI